MTSITMNNRKRWLRAEGGKRKKKKGNKNGEENPKGNGTENEQKKKRERKLLDFVKEKISEMQKKIVCRKELGQVALYRVQQNETGSKCSLPLL